jgi:hypothetical protein
MFPGIPTTRIIFLSLQNAFPTIESFHQINISKIDLEAVEVHDEERNYNSGGQFNTFDLVTSTYIIVLL